MYIVIEIDSNHKIHWTEVEMMAACDTWYIDQRKKEFSCDDGSSHLTLQCDLALLENGQSPRKPFVLRVI